MRRSSGYPEMSPYPTRVHMYKGRVRDGGHLPKEGAMCVQGFVLFFSSFVEALLTKVAYISVIRPDFFKCIKRVGLLYLYIVK